MIMEQTSLNLCKICHRVKKETRPTKKGEAGTCRSNHNDHLPVTCVRMYFCLNQFNLPVLIAALQLSLGTR